MCDSMHVREVHFNKVVNRNVLPQNISSQQREADKKVINICVTFEFETPAAVGYTYRWSKRIIDISTNQCDGLIVLVIDDSFIRRRRRWR